MASECDESTCDFDASRQGRAVYLQVGSNTAMFFRRGCWVVDREGVPWMNVELQLTRNESGHFLSISWDQPPALNHQINEAVNHQIDRELP